MVFYLYQSANTIQSLCKFLLTNSLDQANFQFYQIESFVLIELDFLPEMEVKGQPFHEADIQVPRCHTFRRILIDLLAQVTFIMEYLHGSWLKLNFPRTVLKDQSLQVLSNLLFAGRYFLVLCLGVEFYCLVSEENRQLVIFE